MIGGEHGKQAAYPKQLAFAAVPMRILYDHQAFSLQSHGGITRVFSEIIRYLNSQPKISTTVLLGYSGTKADFHELVSPSGRVFHPGRALFRRRMGNYGLNEALTTLYAPCLGKFDIYHSTLYHFSPAVRAARRVATHHDCAYELFPELFPHRDRILRSKRRMFRQADLVLCVSAASRNDLLRFYDVLPEKAIVVHNGVSAMQRAPGGDSELRMHVRGDFLLYVGTRAAYKNFNGLLQAFADSGAASSYSLLAVGGGPPTRAEVEFITKLGLSDRVRFIAHASPDLLAEAYARSSLLVYPAFYEGFGMPPLEAASVGCPSLVASNPATREVCQDSVFYFDPANPADFSHMLRTALSDNESRAVCLKKAEALLQTYSWENCGRKTLEAYHRLF
jgi:glycosyltransferase involved in cell wall biosynthesis